MLSKWFQNDFKMLSKYIMHYCTMYSPENLTITSPFCCTTKVNRAGHKVPTYSAGDRLLRFFGSVFTSFVEGECASTGFGVGFRGGGRRRRRHTQVVVFPPRRGFWCNCHSSYVRGHWLVSLECSTQGLECTTWLPTHKRYFLAASIDGNLLVPTWGIVCTFLSRLTT